MNRNTKLSCLLVFFSIIVSLLYINSSLVTSKFPTAGQPIMLYSNHLNDDLKKTFVDGIMNAKKSITLVIYSLTDERVINALNLKSREGVEIVVYHDSKASPRIRSKLENKIYTKAIQSKGLMHQKILVVDEQLSWLGSANMTGDSLRMHSNLVYGINNAELAAYLILQAKEFEGHLKNKAPKSITAGPQSLELWHLPNDPEAVNRLIHLIDSAKYSLKIAMFTWSNEELTQAVIRAHKRGLKVETLIDRHSSRGASSKTAKSLYLEGISIKTNLHMGLLHHKFALIDDELLINGSANWTKAAFTKNNDCFMILFSLTNNQKDLMNEIWTVLSSEAKAYYYKK